MDADLTKIYTLTKPPSPENPFLDPVRHAEIIRQFNSGAIACYNLNAWGQLDFYLLASNDYETGLPEGLEEFALKIPASSGKGLEIIYSEDSLEGIFSFRSQEPLEHQALKQLIARKEVDIYFIRGLSEEGYLCSGYKSVSLPVMLRYDIRRFLEGKKPLLLPVYYKNIILDKQVREADILNKAWGFYLDFTTLKGRIGNDQEAEEVISRHVLDAIARLQKSKQKRIKDDCFFIWAGKRVMLSPDNIPREHYSVYINGEFLSEENSRDSVRKVIEKCLQELPEYENCHWTSPLAEEGLPLACLTGRRLYRIEITRRFYQRMERLFQRFCQPAQGYVSYYGRILDSHESDRAGTKVYNMLKLRRRKMSSREL